MVESVPVFLDDLLLGDKGKPGTLRHLAFAAGKEAYRAARNATKNQVISILTDYYCTPGRFEYLWKRLSDAERKIISLHIWGKGFEPANYADEVAKEFGVAANKTKQYPYYLYSRNGLMQFLKRYSREDSALWLLALGNEYNLLFLEELEATIGEMKRTYSTLKEDLPLTTRQSRTSDLISIIRFCNSNKVAVTKSGALSKTSALKLWKFCGYEEYSADVDLAPEDMRTTQGLLVTYPLTTLGMIAGLLTVVEGKCIPGTKALSLLNLPQEQLVKHVFDAYLKSKSFDEAAGMKGLKVKRGHRPFSARQNIAEELKYCPVGRTVYTGELEKYLRIANKAFARKEERHIVSTDNNYYNYGVAWDEYEHRLIDVILSFFGALGLVDILWGEEDSEYSGIRQRVPAVFRINPLGAYVLGLSDSYVAPTSPTTELQDGFTVLPDYTVVVPEGANRVKHELYFEKLLTKVSETNEASIYKIDFGAVVRVLDCGTGIADLRRYLSASDKPLPENVDQSLVDWEKQAGRIRLRQVTILECDEESLLEEVIRYKGMGGLVQEKLAASAVVDGEATAKIKKIIEKNKRFCTDVI